MDDSIRQSLRKLAEEHGLDLELLEQALLSGDIPESLAQSMAEVLGDIGRFDEASGKLEK